MTHGIPPEWSSSDYSSHDGDDEENFVVSTLFGQEAVDRARTELMRVEGSTRAPLDLVARPGEPD